MKLETTEARPRHLAIAVLVAINLLIGILLAPKYGQGIDEAANVRYGEMSLRSYLDPLHPYRDPSREDKGPFYFMAWVAGASLVDRAVPAWLGVDARHFLNFVTWQLAVVSVYLLCLRVAEPSAALMATLLFELQPVLFGHAFINQKDSPFMAFLAAAVVLGLGVVDRLRQAESTTKVWRFRLPSPAALWQDARAAWWEGPVAARRRMAAVIRVALVMAIGWALLDRPIRAVLSNIVIDAYRGRAWGPINELFIRIAQNAMMTPVAAYVARANLILNVATIVGAAGLAAAMVWGTLWFWRSLAKKLQVEVPRSVFIAAVVLGMATAIRSVALFVFLLVACYAFFRVGPRCIGLIFVYLAIATGVAFVLWPQLWGSPLEWVRSGLERTLQFPEQQEVLFRGRMYSSDSLPRAYLPWLLIIQLTLPVVALALGGLILTARVASRKGASAPFARILLLWFLVPFVAVVVFGVPIYNNFRQLLFMIPPLFVMAAMALDRLIPRSRIRWFAPVLGVVTLLPGVSGLIRLHPYEYVYYNELVGGVSGAFGRYSLDYWCTSYREVMRAVNEFAPPNARIAVWGPKSPAQAFFREDLKLVSVDTHSSGDLDAFVVVGCSWAITDLGFFPDAPVIWEVERDGATLGIVKDVSSWTSGPYGPPGR